MHLYTINILWISSFTSVQILFEDKVWKMLEPTGTTSNFLVHIWGTIPYHILLRFYVSQLAAFSEFLKFYHGFIHSRAKYQPTHRSTLLRWAPHQPSQFSLPPLDCNREPAQQKN